MDSLTGSQVESRGRASGRKRASGKPSESEANRSEAERSELRTLIRGKARIQRGAASESEQARRVSERNNGQKRSERSLYRFEGPRGFSLGD